MRIQTSGHINTLKTFTFACTIRKHKNLEVLYQVNWSARKVHCWGLFRLEISAVTESSNCLSFYFLGLWSAVWNTSLSRWSMGRTHRVHLAGVRGSGRWRRVEGDAGLLGGNGGAGSQNVRTWRMRGRWCYQGLSPMRCQTRTLQPGAAHGQATGSIGSQSGGAWLSPPPRCRTAFSRRNGTRNRWAGPDVR